MISMRTLNRYVELNRMQITRALIVLGVLGLTALPALLGSARLSTLLLAAGIALPGAIILLRRPGLGLLGLIIAAPLIDFSVGTGTQSRINLPMLIVAGLTGLWIMTLWHEREFALSDSRPVRALAAFILASLFAFAIGTQPWLEFATTAPIMAQVGGLGIFLLSAALFLVVGHRIDERWLARTMLVFLAIGTIYLIGRFIPSFGAFLDRRFASGATGSMFWTWLAVLPLGQALYNRRLSPPARFAMFAIAGATLYVTYVQINWWKSGWIPPLVGAALLIALRHRLLMIASLLAGPVIASQLIVQVIATDIYSYSTRLDAWRILIEIVRANPITGLGPANYYWYAPLFAIRGYYVQFNSHNQYIDIIAQTGIVGMLALAWFLVSIALLTWRIRGLVPDGFERGYVYGVLGGIGATVVAGMLGDWFLPFVYNVGLDGFRSSLLPWLFMGGIVALERRYAAEESEP